MSRRSTQSVGAFVLFVAGCVCAPVIGHGQAPPPKAASTQAPAGKPKPWVVPRTADGKPDLQGNWTNETQTPLERMGAAGRDADRRAGRGDRAARATRRRDPRQAERSRTARRRRRAATPAGSRAAGRAVVHRADFRGGRRRGGRLQRLLARSRPERHPHRRRGAQLDHHRPAERAAAGADRRRQEAAGRDRRARRSSSASSITPRCGRWPIAACCRSARTPGRRCCRTTSTTTTTPSCRPRIT